MTTLKNVIGQRFGKLVVIEKDGCYKNGDAKWICKCDCGNIRKAKGYYLRRGIKSCVKCNFTNYLNLKIGKLLVLERIEDKLNLNGQKIIQWKCQCNCGAIIIRTSRHLNRGNCCCKDCKANIDKKNNFRGVGEISGIFWSSLKRQAKLRNLEFDISLEYIWELFIKQNRRCSVSNLEIGFALSKKEYLNGKTTASLDRINSKLGYIKDNIQWVHKWINLMKSDFEQQEFVEY